MRSIRVLSRVGCVLAAVALVTPCVAQNRFTFNAGGGFTEPVRQTDGRLDTGFNLGVGAGVNLLPRLGILGEFNFNHAGLTSAALNAAGAPAGSSRIYSLTFNPIFHVNPRGRFDAYAIGGGGYYRRTIEFTQPTVRTVTAFDPFFGVFYPVAVPANLILGSSSQNVGGLNIGGGVSFRVRGDSNAKFYAETRYHHLLTSPRPTTILPVTFGFRW